MKIKWKIDYKYQIARYSQMTVSVKEVESPTMQVFDGIKIGFGFQKLDSEKMYEGHIISMTDELLNKSKENPQLLSQYGSQLGDIFNEYEWHDERIKDVLQTLGEKPKDKELAKYLNVTAGAVSQYEKSKKELMILGLWIKKIIK